jgi:DNA-binding cell septation regulator SpoVG
MIRISQVKITPISRGRVLAYAEFVIDDSFSIGDVILLKRSNGYAVVMPQANVQNGRTRQFAFALDRDTWNAIKQAVVAEYEKISPTTQPAGLRRKRRPRQRVHGSFADKMGRGDSAQPRSLSGKD